MVDPDYDLGRDVRSPPRPAVRVRRARLEVGVDVFAPYGAFGTSRTGQSLTTLPTRTSSSYVSKVRPVIRTR